MIQFRSKKENNPGSSSGRTEDSGSLNGGSNPSPGVFKALVIWGNRQNGELSHQKIFRVAKNFRFNYNLTCNLRKSVR